MDFVKKKITEINLMGNRFNNKIKYSVYGALFGLCFPVFGLLFDILYQELPISWDSVLLVQSENPIHYIIYTAPLFLGLFAFLGGVSQDKIVELNKGLSGKFDEKQTELNEEVNQKAELLEQIAGLQSNLSVLVETSPDAIWSVDKEGKILVFNERFLEFFNGKVKDVSKDLDIREYFTTNDYNLFWGPKLEEVFKGRKVVVDRIQNGLHLEISIHPIYQKEEIHGAAIFCRDISARVNMIHHEKKAEMAQKEAQFKDRFLANMSHEIRTPLNGILGIVEMMTMDDRLLTEHRQMLDIVNASSQNLLAIINDILDLSKIQAGQLRLQYEPCELRPSLNRLVTLFTAKAQAKGLNVLYQVSDEVGEMINCDRNRMSQILSNLINNAIKFTDSGEVRVRCSLNPDDKRRILFEVSDTGIGIREEDLGRIFKKFSQLDSGANKMFEGTGLGLEISRRIVELMHGKIGVRSEFGKGSTFWFELPYNPVQMAATTKNEDTDGELQTIKRRVLIVDDKQVNLQVAKLYMSKLNFEVELATNGQDALDLFKTGGHSFDLVLMDIQMPVLDGITAMKRLKMMEMDIPPIVALTANAMEGDRSKYLEMGFDGYISKPIQMDNLKNELKKIFAAKPRSQAKK